MTQQRGCWKVVMRPWRSIHSFKENFFTFLHNAYSPPFGVWWKDATAFMLRQEAGRNSQSASLQSEKNKILTNSTPKHHVFNPYKNRNLETKVLLSIIWLKVGTFPITRLGGKSAKTLHSHFFFCIDYFYLYCIFFTLWRARLSISLLLYAKLSCSPPSSRFILDKEAVSILSSNSWQKTELAHTVHKILTSS